MTCLSQGPTTTLVGCVKRALCVPVYVRRKAIPNPTPPLSLPAPSDHDIFSLSPFSIPLCFADLKARQKSGA